MLILLEITEHMVHWCYIHSLLKDLSTGSFLRDFKIQHYLGEEEPVKPAHNEPRKTKILLTFLFKGLSEANMKHQGYNIQYIISSKIWCVGGWGQGWVVYLAPL